MKKICFLVSGGGGNMKFLHQAIKLNVLKQVTLSVIADRECQAIEYAKKNDLRAKMINYSRNKNTELLEELKNIDPDIIITNWHKIIDEEIVRIYEGKLINLHYSLLPAFPGMIGIRPIEEAYKKNCKFIGVTCHQVDTGIDTGDIIAQAIVKADISIDVVIQKIFEKGCLILLNTIVKKLKIDILGETNSQNQEYSPNLTFDSNQFNDKFWKKMKEL